MPAKDIIVSAIVCEKILAEADGILSAIRAADVFYFTPAPPELNIPIKNQAIVISLLGVGRLPIDDVAEHTIEVQLIRPNGAMKSLGDLHKGPLPTRMPGVPPGFNINVQAPVIPEQMGVHYFVILVDGAEVARALFTLVQREAAVLE